ncbi:unnamed protein product [Diabrotica balteata]|uniref:Uncharacterized protein n=1 Tax=Diabrotica balteata TaxID=107213 RepID=A0A9N9SSY5_DIABA|nr:unnamed protein product [Diabrotica balteata]
MVFVFVKLIFKPTSLLAAFTSPLISSCCSAGLLAIKTMTSANLRWLRYSLSMNRPFVMRVHFAEYIF